MKHFSVAVALLLLASVVVADNISLGYTGETGFYDGASVSGSVGDFDFYVEHAGEYDYSLFMLDAPVSKHERFGIRFENPNIWRPYVEESRTFGDVWTMTRLTIGGLGDGEHRLDTFAGVPIHDYGEVKIEGEIWGRFRPGLKADISIGPRLTYKNLSGYYGFNLRGVGDDAIFASYRIWQR